MKDINLQTMNSTTGTLENSITIGIATTPAEKREIYHFRYKTYVEEMCKHVKGVDYANQLLFDELDEWGYLLYAKIGSEIIATTRINIGTLADFPQEVVQFLSLDTFQNTTTENSNHKYAYCAKLLIAAPHRNSPALYLIIAKTYELFCCNQVEYAFAVCNLYLLRLYEQMGFHRYGKNFTPSGYGLLTPIVLAVNDIQHLRSVRSPFLRIARKREVVSPQEVAWFHTNVTKHTNNINSQIVTEDELWAILCTRLNCPPTDAITILSGLSIAEAKKFIHCCGILAQCEKGDKITIQGDISYSYDTLISGKLASLTFRHPVKEYTTPGQHFGANGLTEHNKHTEDIVVMDSTELLVLSSLAFQKFSHSCPTIAHKIVKTIINLTRNKQLGIKRF